MSLSGIIQIAKFFCPPEVFWFPSFFLSKGYISFFKFLGYLKRKLVDSFVSFDAYFFLFTLVAPLLQAMIYYYFQNLRHCNHYLSTALITNHPSQKISFTSDFLVPHIACVTGHNSSILYLIVLLAQFFHTVSVESKKRLFKQSK